MLIKTGALLIISASLINQAASQRCSSNVDCSTLRGLYCDESSYPYQCMPVKGFNEICTNDMECYQGTKGSSCNFDVGLIKTCTCKFDRKFDSITSSCVDTDFCRFDTDCKKSSYLTYSEKKCRSGSCEWVTKSGSGLGVGVIVAIVVGSLVALIVAGVLIGKCRSGSSTTVRVSPNVQHAPPVERHVQVPPPLPRGSPRPASTFGSRPPPMNPSAPSEQFSTNNGAYFPPQAQYHPYGYNGTPATVSGDVSRQQGYGNNGFQYGY